MGRRRRSPEAKKRIAARREQRKKDERQKAVGTLGEDQVAMNEKLDLPIGFDPNRSGGFQNSAEARKHREYMKTFEQAKEQDFRDSTITKDNLAQSAIDTATGIMSGQQDIGDMSALSPLTGGSTGKPQNPNGPTGKPGQAQDEYQTGAPRGSYMDRVRRQRAMQGQAGYGQYGPMQGPGPYAGGPVGPGGFQNPVPKPRRKRTYNPETGLME
mgnify:CR=1 FL=1